MEELFKNSLLGQLKELGLNPNIEEEPNPLAIHVNGSIENSPFADNPIKKDSSNAEVEEPYNDEAAQKRLNDLDLNILQDSAIKKTQSEFSGANILGKLLYKYFPEIYKGYLLKRALKKLKSINQTAVDLISKKTPYGESDARYNALIEYLSNSNTIHAKLAKKI